MKCDNCGEQLPVGDEIGLYKQILCLECAMQGYSCRNILIEINPDSLDEDPIG